MTKTIFKPAGANPYVFTSTPVFGSGDRAFGSGESEWVYAKSSEALTIGRTTLVNVANTSFAAAIGANTALANTHSWQFAWPQIAVAVASPYGWFQTAGAIDSARSAASFAGKGATVSVLPNGDLSSTGHQVHGFGFTSNTGAQVVPMPAYADKPSSKD